MCALCKKKMDLTGCDNERRQSRCEILEISKANRECQRRLLIIQSAKKRKSESLGDFSRVAQEKRDLGDALPMII